MQARLPDGTIIETGTTDAAGLLSFTMANDTELWLTAQRAFDPARDGRITPSDALDVLRLAVGLTPSWGSTSPINLIAADINRDGQVNASDALDVLRAAVGLTSANPPRWLFVDSNTDMSGISRSNTVIAEGLRFDPMQVDLSGLSMTGVLLGSMQDHV